MIEGTDYRLTPLLSEDEIQDKIREIGQNLSGRFKNEVIFLAVSRMKCRSLSGY